MYESIFGENPMKMMSYITNKKPSVQITFKEINLSAGLYLHIQKKVDIIDDEVVFITFRLRKKMLKGKESSEEGKHSLFHYSIRKKGSTWQCRKLNMKS